MSADEIRRLSEFLIELKYSDYCDIPVADYHVIEDAAEQLRNHAAMVERCEEKVKYLESIRERGDTEIIDIALRDMNYILKGDPDEDSPHGS